MALRKASLLLFTFPFSQGISLKEKLAKPLSD